MQIGVAGIGKMGAAIAQRLMEVGHDVTVWNRTAGEGASGCGCRRGGRRHPAELARNAHASSPSSPMRLRSSGLWRACRPARGDVDGKLFIEMSTVEPADRNGTCG